MNGGVNTQTGDMILLMEGDSGLQQQLELPFDQSGPMLEMLERAAKAAGEWHDKRAQDVVDGLTPINIQAREAEYVMLGHDPVSDRPILVTRLQGGHQFSFILDQKIMEQLRRHPLPASKEQPRAVENPWVTIAEDIEWLQREWCTVYEPPHDEELRRGTAVLRRLLLDGNLQAAWIHFGFERSPRLSGPDIVAILKGNGHELRRVVSMVAGGAICNGIQMSAIGAARTHNRTTGVSADADEGFAVEVFSVARSAVGEPVKGELKDLAERSWNLNAYLDAPGAIRLGQTLSRRDIIQYFANSAGGVHLDYDGKRHRTQEETYRLLRELDQKVVADTMDGLFFELLSIGQAIAKSEDLAMLARSIRSVPAKAKDIGVRLTSKLPFK